MANMALWVDHSAAKPHAEDVMADIRSLAQRSSRSINVHDEVVARSVAERYVADAAMLRDWFYSSIGIVDEVDGVSKETFYLSQSPNAYVFAGLNVVPWTNWLGDLYVRARAILESGGFPEQLEYGPPKHFAKRPLGPVIDYRFRDGSLVNFDYYFHQIEEIAEPIEAEEEKPQFGLRQIIRTIDVDQNEQIRGPMRGIFILIGGPGVGKTTVALHRIPYLINEQIPYEERTTNPESQHPEFYTQHDTLVVVWKPHLVPYLRNCIKQQLQLFDFPDHNVKHINDWMESQLRPYVSLGVRSHRIEESDPAADLKHALDENDLAEFLASDFPLKAENRREFQSLLAKTKDALGKVGQSLNNPPSIQFSADGVDRAVQQLTSLLPVPDRLGRYSRQADEQLREEFKQTRDRLVERTARYVDMLRSFYRSELAQTRIRGVSGDDGVRGLSQAVDQQEKGKQITRPDLYFLLWLIHIQTRDSSSNAQRHRPLGVYSHVVIDEAQYYEPLVLRLLADLAQLPEGTMTIVGDLEQRIRSKGGLIQWEQAGLDVDPENVCRLVTNYRWSKQVFQFLQIFRDRNGIKEELNPPRRWYSGEGRRPEIHTLPSASAEIEDIVNAVTELRSTAPSEHWTAAVVIPPSADRSERDRLVTLLQSCGIAARWASDEDVKESVDKVIVTDYDNIVGLEFDFVCVMGIDRLIASEGPAGVQALWVALTRARRFLLVTRIGGDAIFDEPAFADYRV